MKHHRDPGHADLRCPDDATGQVRAAPLLIPHSPRPGCQSRLPGNKTHTVKTILTCLTALLLAPLPALRAADTWHQPRPGLRCLYNIESLMHCNEDISAAKIKWVVEKLRGTDVDAIMCCPTAWRMNMFPSEVDPEWRKFTHIRQIPAFQPYDHVMQYIHGGGDPVRDQLEASRDKSRPALRAKRPV